MKYYALMYDKTPTGNYKTFHEHLVANPRITRWFHYIQSSYLIGTDMTVQELSEYVRAAFAQAGLPTIHLVVRIDARKRQGLLTPKAWDWFKQAVINQDPP
jgi:hypothetical protein